MRDDFDAVVADRFKVFDDVTVPDTWSRVQLELVDHRPVSDTRSPVRAADEVVTMIDVKTTDSTERRQNKPRRVAVAGIVAAAAAMLAIAFVVIRDTDDVTPADEPAPTVTVPPTTPPPALPNTPDDQFVPGTYFVDEVDGTPTARIFFTIGAGWRNTTGQPGRIFGKWETAGDGIDIIDLGFIQFDRPGAVFSDACHWSDGYRPGPVATVDSLVTALSEQRGWADVTAPSDISVDGYAGKAFQRTVPAEISDCDTAAYGPRIRPANWNGSPLPAFRSWEGAIYEPGEVETVWVLDIDSTVVVIDTRLFPSVTTGARALAGPSAAVRDEFAAVLDSIRIDRG
jgi:hypothetical protein